MNQTDGKLLVVRVTQALYKAGKRESWDWAIGSRNRASEKSGFQGMINESSDSHVGIESVVALCMSGITFPLLRKLCVHLLLT